MALAAASAVSVGLVVVVISDQPDERALTVRSRRTEPPTVTTVPVDSTTTTALGVASTTTTRPPAPTPTVPPAPTTTTGRPRPKPTVNPPRLGPAACSTAPPMSEAPGAGVTVLSPAGDLRQIIDGSESIQSIAWAPDGERLAVVRLSSTASRVAVVDLDGWISYPSGDDRVKRPVAWTTDGQVIYVVDYWDKADGHPHDRVRIVAASGGEPTTVWDGRSTTFGVVGVAGLPDGRVMFLSDEGLMVVNRDGTGVQALTPVGMTRGEPDAPALPRASVRNFALSPDGSRVATVAGGELAMIDVASGAKLASTAASVPDVVEWSADSRRVGFAGGIVLADDGQVTHTGGDDVAFSGSGPELAVVSRPPEGAPDARIAEIVNGDGSRQVVAHRVSEVAWGPALAMIVDPPDDRLGGPQGGAMVCLVGQDRPVAAFPNSDPAWLSWSPDGRHLALMSQSLDWIRP